MKVSTANIAALVALTLCASALHAQPAVEVSKIRVGVGKTYLLDSAIDIERILLGPGEVAEAIPVSNRTLAINGKTPGETSAVVWLTDGTRKEYTVSVATSTSRVDAAKEQIAKEFGDKVQLTGDATAVYLTGIVKSVFASERATAIGGTVSTKVVNLLNVEVPPQEQEILLKVRFADVDRSKSLNLGLNVLGQPGGFPFNVTTGANTPSRFTAVSPPTNTLSDALNVLMFDPHANILATLEALQASNVLQILAEPNVLAMNGKVARFVAGGEFPYPTLQGGGSGVGQVTIQFREFGIKLAFIPTITPRGTIKLHVAPEVSSLDYANALTVEGSTVPALTTRKVETEVELQDGQSFAIAGLLDQQTTDTLSKIPGLSNIPVLGKFFQSKSVSKSNSELIVIVTPELVAPIPKDQPLPEIRMPAKFMDGPDVDKIMPKTPGVDVTGPLPAKPVRDEVSVQEMEKIQRDEQAQSQQSLGSTTGASSAGGTGISNSGGGGVAAAPAGTITVPSVPVAPTTSTNSPNGPNVQVPVQ